MNEFFQFITTEDGSPSLRIVTGAGLTESMHSLRGALSETEYIYGQAVSKTLELESSLRVLSMGLGLGYNELLTAALWIQSENSGEFYLESFESVDELKAYFLAWLSLVSHQEDSQAFERSESQTTAPVSGPNSNQTTPNQTKPIPLPPDFASAYEEIGKMLTARTRVSSAEIAKFLLSARERGAWKLRDTLDPQTEFAESLNCLLFDAFSSKSTPELWTEEFLDRFFSKVAAPTCVFSTYACTGALKRSLRKAGFELNIREGFASKRDCTFAVRSLHRDPKKESGTF